VTKFESDPVTWSPLVSAYNMLLLINGSLVCSFVSFERCFETISHSATRCLLQLLINSYLHVKATASRNA